MAATNPTTMPKPGADSLSIPQLLFVTVLGIGVFGLVIFWPAGTLRWSHGWLYLVLVIAYMVVNLTYLQQVNPELIRHRMRFGSGTKSWDIVWSALFLPLMLSVYVVAGFDAVRFQWTQMPFGWWYLGFVIFAPGAWLFSWSMGVNPFFEKTVRIQTERGHRVIDTGPYAYLRHPGYLGFFGWILSAPLLLGSVWAFVPSLGCIGALVLRTALEDRTLCRELEGYEEYTARVRYRLLPGVW